MNNINLMTLLSDIQYFPSVILYKSLYNCSNIIFEQYEAYQKMSFRNRCQIAGAQGVVELSVPLTGGRDQKTMVREVRISDRRPWAAQHWKTIVSCYSRSPWFDHYREELEGLYRQKWDFLLDWDLACFDWSLRVLGIARPVGLTTKWRRDYTGEEVTDLRGKLRPKVGGGNGSGEPGEASGPKMGEAGGAAGGGAGSGGGAPALLGGEKTRRYRQVFEERTGFIPDLSILDLLFCEGPQQVIKYIQSP
jgi:hypothetical protein